MSGPVSKRWKAITLDWQALQSYDDETVLGVCLTQRQVAILKALLTTAYWATRWTNLGISLDALQAEMADLDNQLDGNDCGVMNMEFRQNPDDLCEVQYSNDEGETWSTMFRQDTCRVALPSNSQQITNIYDDSDTITNNYTTWNNDILNVAPDWEYEDVFNDNALCLVLDYYIEWICEIAIKTINSDNAERRAQNDWLDDVSVILSGGVIAAIAAVSSTPIVLPVIAVGAITYATANIVEYIWDYLVTQGTDYYTDLAARDAVKCWMWLHLRGETPQWDVWTTSLDDFEGANSAETAIATTVAFFNDDVNVYINYMLLMQDFNTIKESLPECDCPVAYTINQLQGPTGAEDYGYELCHSTLVAFSNPGDTPAVCPGFLNFSQQYYSQILSSIGGVGCNIRVVLPPNTIVVGLSVKMSAYRYPQSSSGDKNAAVYVGEPDVDGVYVAGYSWGTGQGVWQYITVEQYNPAVFPSTPRSHVWIHNSMDRDDGFARILWVHIECELYEP